MSETGGIASEMRLSEIAAGRKKKGNNKQFSMISDTLHGLPALLERTKNYVSHCISLQFGSIYRREGGVQ